MSFLKKYAGAIVTLIVLLLVFGLVALLWQAIG